MLKLWVGWGGVVVAHKILVSAPVPLELILTGFDWVGVWALEFWDLGRGLTITLYFIDNEFGHYIGLSMTLN